MQVDVAIVGGGLAGLCAGLQAKATLKDKSILILERTEGDAPEAAHKVGESSVELGSHYFDTVLGLKDYLESDHLHKNGLRFFLGDTQGKIEDRIEVGPVEFPPVPSYQMDRGKLENELRRRCRDAGILLEGKNVQSIVLDNESEDHQIIYKDADGEHTLFANFVIDASGRKRFIQREQKLQIKVEDNASSCWFRLDKKIDINDFAEKDSLWRNRDVDGTRWQSTNHLVGKGYWLWVIPLSGDRTSIGIVADNSIHPFLTFNTPAKADEWIRKHEPQAAEHLCDIEKLDFGVMHQYRYHSQQIYSRRWACVGEAGLFVDPLYSPGSDFVGLTNSLAIEMAKHHFAGTLSDKRIDEYNRIVLAWMRDTTNMLNGNGEIFGRPEVFSLKLWWDFFQYWAFMTTYFFDGIYQLDEVSLEKFHSLGDEFFALDADLQDIFKTWATLSAASYVKTKKYVPLPMFPSHLSDAHVCLPEERTPEQTEALMNKRLVEAKAFRWQIAERAMAALNPESQREFSSKLPLESWKREATEIETLQRDLNRAHGRIKKKSEARATL